MRILHVAFAIILSSGYANAQQLRASDISDIVNGKEAGFTTVPLKAIEGHLIADCTIQGLNVKMMLDTGTNSTQIDSSIAKKLNLKSEGDFALLGIDGLNKGYLVDLVSMKVGGFDTSTIANSVSAFAREGKTEYYGGLLSLQALSLFGAIIDYPARAMYLRKPITVAWPKLSGSWKAVSWTDSGINRRLQADTAPIFKFTNERLTITDGNSSKEYAIDYLPGNEHDSIYFYDPKQAGLIDRSYLAGGLIKVDGENITVCFFLDIGKIKAVPTEFKSEPGSGHVLIKLKQPGKKSIPDPVKQTLTKRGYTAVPLIRESNNGMLRVDAKHLNVDWPMALDTGANVTCIDDAIPKANNIKPTSQEKISGDTGEVLASIYYLYGYSFGRYQTRAHWLSIKNAGIDLSPFNAERAARKQVPLYGILGGQELLDGSAIIDLATNTLYLRPVKETIQPQLAGTWVVKASTFDGVRRVRNDQNETLTINKDRMIFKGGQYDAEYGYHIRDEWERYRAGFFDPKANVLAENFTYTSAGYFQLEGDSMKFVRVVDKEKILVPNGEFVAPKGSGLMLLEYTRKK